MPASAGRSRRGRLLRGARGQRGGAGPGLGRSLDKPLPAPRLSPAPPLNSDARAAGCERAVLRPIGGSCILSRRLRRLWAVLSRPAAGRRRSRPERAPEREPRAFVRAPRWVSLPHLLCTQRLRARGRLRVHRGGCAALAQPGPPAPGTPGLAGPLGFSSPLPAVRAAWTVRRGVAVCARGRSSGR